MDTNDVFRLELHEKTSLDMGTCAMRVPGGLIYTFGSEFGTAAVFVPVDADIFRSFTKK